MKPVSEIVALVCDHGRFVPVAQRLARDYRQVFYWSPADTDCPSITRGCIGDGFDNIQRVNSPFEVKEQCDLFVFADVGFSALQKELRSQGKPVWGGFDADKLETNRGLFLNTIKEIGFPTPHFEPVRGITRLREHLREQTDKYIKISRWRGDFETLHWRSWEEDEGLLDYYAFKFGPCKELIMFYVFDPIDTKIEDGVDTWCIDGKLPSICLHAMEAKDKALLGTMVPFKDIPEVVRGVTEEFAPVLAEYGYRQFFSTEVRITQQSQPFFIDPTLRAGSPPHQVQCELIGNYGEVIWHGANGECIDPEPTAEFGVQAIVNHAGEESAWDEVKIPDEIDPWFKCGFACKIDGKLCIPPGLGSHAMWLTATGDTIQKAIDNLKDHAAMLPDGMECRTDSIADLLKEIDTAEASGLAFTEQPVPEPAVVIQ